MSYLLCIDCVKDKWLKRLLRESGEQKKCDMCGKISDYAIDIQNKDFQILLKALIRYHYSETRYNSHWGGYSNWVGLFSEKNPIFNFIYNWKQDNEKFSFELDSIEGHIRDYDNDVSLYYGGGRMDAFMSSVKDDTCEVIQRLEREIEVENSYLIANKLAKHIKRLFKILDNRLSDKKYFRARIGTECILSDKFSLFTDNYDEVVIPYKDELISSPKPIIALEGRLNRKKTAYLYLASDIDTAIAEVKPSIGHYVSLGEFEIIGDLDKLHIADFYNIDFYNFARSDTDIENYIVLKSLKERLSLPNPNKDYDFTQVIADALILLGFDGVKFESSVGKGYNLVLFDYHRASYIKDSHKAILIKEVQYRYQSLNTNLDVSEKIEFYVKNDIDKNADHIVDDIIEKHFGIKDYYKKIYEITDFIK